MNEQEQQEIILRLSLYEQQMQQLQEQMQAIENGILELQSLCLGLNELEGKKDEEIMAHVGRGIFARAKLLEDDLLVDVGNKNFVKKTIPETQKIIEMQVKKFEAIKKEINSALEKLAEEMQKIVDGVQEQEKD